MRMWEWLRWNGSVLQSAASLVGALIGLITVPVLIATWRAARNAAQAAAEQAAAARELTQVSWAQQRAAERAAAAAEAQVSSAEASTALAKQRLAAAEETAAAERAHNELVRQQTLAALTPVLRFSSRYGSAFSWTVLENESGALALDIIAFNGTPEMPGAPIALSHTTLAPGAEASVGDGDIEWRVQFDHGNTSYPEPIPIFARYRSSDGRWFRTIVADFRPGPSTARQQIVEQE